jgi:hypothetical protein
VNKKSRRHERNVQRTPVWILKLNRGDYTFSTSHGDLSHWFSPEATRSERPSKNPIDVVAETALSFITVVEYSTIEAIVRLRGGRNVPRAVPV